MRDRLSKERRSWNMSRIRGKDTTPEKRVRSLLHRLGYRFRLHSRIPIQSGTQERRKKNSLSASQPSTINSQLRQRRFVTPDLVLPKYKLAIFVHGCFWHRHRGCRNCTTPTNNRAFWLKKLNGNAARDKVHQRVLRKLGWRTLVVWECEIEKLEKLARLRLRLARALSPLSRKPKAFNRRLRG